MYARFAERVAFFVVYIREAHPVGEWEITTNRREGIAVEASKTKAERATTAAECALRLSVKLPMLIDDIDNEVARAYGAWPDRLYLVRQGGEVAFRGAPGPKIQTRELEDAIELELRSAHDRRG